MKIKNHVAFLRHYESAKAINLLQVIQEAEDWATRQEKTQDLNEEGTKLYLFRNNRDQFSRFLRECWEYGHLLNFPDQS